MHRSTCLLLAWDWEPVPLAKASDVDACRMLCIRGVDRKRLWRHVTRRGEGQRRTVVGGRCCWLVACLLNVPATSKCNKNNDNDNNTSIHRRNSRILTTSSLCHELSPTCTLKWPRRNCVQITCNTFRAYHMQHVALHAIWYKETAQLLSLTVEIAFVLASPFWLIN